MKLPLIGLQTKPGGTATQPPAPSFLPEATSVDSRFRKDCGRPSEPLQYCMAQPFLTPKPALWHPGMTS